MPELEMIKGQIFKYCDDVLKFNIDCLEFRKKVFYLCKEYVDTKKKDENIDFIYQCFDLIFEWETGLISGLYLCDEIKQIIGIGANDVMLWN